MIIASLVVLLISCSEPTVTAEYRIEEQIAVKLSTVVSKLRLEDLHMIIMLSLMTINNVPTQHIPLEHINRIVEQK